jgi:hypothetical protein
MTGARCKMTGDCDGSQELGSALHFLPYLSLLLLNIPRFWQ